MMLDAFNCPNCGAPAHDAGVKLCGYCNSSFIIRHFADVSDKALEKYSDLYKKITSSDPDYFDTQISLIAIYIKRRLSALARAKAQSLLQEYPDHAQSHLWGSLVEMTSQPIRKMKIAIAKDCVARLTTAFDLSNGAERGDIIRIGIQLGEEYYSANGLNAPEQLRRIVSNSDQMGDPTELLASIMEKQSVNS